MNETTIRHEVKHAIAATDALIRFLELHECHVPEHLRQSRDAMAAGDVKTGCALAYTVRPFGNGGIGDEYPTRTLDYEDETYCWVVQEALVRNWCFWVSVADDQAAPRWRKVIRAIGSMYR
jgi:hypothetical protein